MFSNVTAQFVPFYMYLSLQKHKDLLQMMINASKEKVEKAESKNETLEYENYRRNGEEIKYLLRMLYFLSVLNRYIYSL